MFWQTVVQCFTLCSALTSIWAGFSLSAGAQPLSPKIPEKGKLHFRGVVPTIGEIGQEYIIFQTDKNNQAHGLVYLQNSDIGACFQGSYQSSTNQIQNLTYAYPIIGEDAATGWETNVSNQAIHLQQFSHQLDPTAIHPSARNWFAQCRSLFQNP